MRKLALLLCCAACSGPARETRPPPPRTVKAPPEPMHATGPDGSVRVAMSQDELRRLVRALDLETGDKAKLAMLQTAARNNWVTAAQAGALIDHVVYRDDKLQAVPLLKERILDPQNAYMLYQHFTYREDKARVQELLER